MRRYGFTFRGVCYRAGSLTLAEVESIESTLGVPYVTHNPTGDMSHKRVYISTFLQRTHSRSQVEEILSTLRLSDVESMWGLFDDDLPSVYQDGFPSIGGNTFDAYVIAFSKPPKCWPPSVTRQLSLRDCALIFEAQESEPEREG